MISSKPFVARGSRIERCPNCLLAPSVCICEFKVSYLAKADFLLLIHHDEAFKPTNTGRLIEDCISGTQRFKWSRTEPSEELLRVLNDPNVDPYIVFPESEKHADRMVSYAPKPNKKPLFIVLDGTWRQASRMFRLSRYLDHLPVIQPEVNRSSSYKLRKAASEGQLCTAEVAAEMLGVVGDVKGQLILSAYFEVFNDHYKASRMCKTLDDHTAAKTLLRSYKNSDVVDEVS